MMERSPATKDSIAMPNERKTSEMFDRLIFLKTK
jgi:hypothetical protein